MALTLKLEIVTPQATVFSSDVDLVTLPTADGEIGIYPQHVRLITQLVPGEIIVSKDGQDTYLAVGEGLVDVDAAHVSTLTDMAVRAADIDEVAVTEERARASGRQAAREALGRGSRLGQRVAGARRRPAPGQAPLPRALITRTLFDIT